MRIMEWLVVLCILCPAVYAADVDLIVTVPDAKVQDMQDAVDYYLPRFNVQVKPYSIWQAETGGNKKQYAEYLLKESLKAWYKSSLDFKAKRSYDAVVDLNKDKSLD